MIFVAIGKLSKEESTKYSALFLQGHIGENTMFTDRGWYNCSDLEEPSLPISIILLVGDMITNL